MATKLVAFVITFGVLAGCKNDVCARKSDCPQGLLCSAAGMCVASPDAGSGDTDAGTTIDGGP